jgi:galactokinase
MNDSHASLRDLYEVSCEELDFMVERAVAQPGCHGARMTGAGFGGCAVALVDSAAGEAFARAVESEYRRRYDLPAQCFACRPAEGAHLV